MIEASPPQEQKGPRDLSHVTPRESDTTSPLHTTVGSGSFVDIDFTESPKLEDEVATQRPYIPQTGYGSVIDIEGLDTEKKRGASYPAGSASIAEKWIKGDDLEDFKAPDSPASLFQKRSGRLEYVPINAGRDSGHYVFDMKIEINEQEEQMAPTRKVTDLVWHRSNFTENLPEELAEMYESHIEDNMISIKAYWDAQIEGGRNPKEVLATIRELVGDSSDLGLSDGEQRVTLDNMVEALFLAASKDPEGFNERAQNLKGADAIIAEMIEEVTQGGWMMTDSEQEMLEQGDMVGVISSVDARAAEDFADLDEEEQRAFAENDDFDRGEIARKITNQILKDRGIDANPDSELVAECGAEIARKYDELETRLLTQKAEGASDEELAETVRQLTGAPPDEQITIENMIEVLLTGASTDREGMAERSAHLDDADKALAAAALAATSGDGMGSSEEARDRTAKANKDVAAIRDGLKEGYSEEQAVETLPDTQPSANIRGEVVEAEIVDEEVTKTTGGRMQVTIEIVEDDIVPDAVGSDDEFDEAAEVWEVEEEDATSYEAELSPTAWAMNTADVLIQETPVIKETVHPHVHQIVDENVRREMIAASLITTLHHIDALVDQERRVITEELRDQDEPEGDIDVRHIEESAVARVESRVPELIADPANPETPVVSLESPQGRMTLAEALHRAALYDQVGLSDRVAEMAEAYFDARFVESIIATMHDEADADLQQEGDAQVPILDGVTGVVIGEPRAHDSVESTAPITSGNMTGIDTSGFASTGSASGTDTLAGSGADTASGDDNDRDKDKRSKPRIIDIQ